MTRKSGTGTRAGIRDAGERRRRTAFVPRMVMATAFLGVIPACALVACSSSSDSEGTSDTGGDTGKFGVADTAFDTNNDSGYRPEFGVADIGFVDTRPVDDGRVAVADIGFMDDGTADGSDAGDGAAKDGDASEGG